MRGYKSPYALYYQPRKLRRHSERRTMVLATMVVLWDALVMVLTPVLTLALLLLVLLTIVNGLVALYWNWKALLVHW